jgi:hypothetical protein
VQQKRKLLQVLLDDEIFGLFRRRGKIYITRQEVEPKTG